MLGTVAPAAGSSDAGGGAVEIPRTESFLALTYNVAGLPAALSGSEPHINSPLISPLLNDYDLVLLQEDWVDPVPPIPNVDFHHDDIVGDALHPFRSVPGRPPLGTDTRRPSALVADGLNRLSDTPFGPIRRRMWPGCFGGADQSDGGAGDCLSQKGFSMARHRLASGVEVDIYNLHAEAGGTVTDQSLQVQDYDALADFIELHSVGRAIIVGGDTNLHTDQTHPDASGSADFDIWSDFQARTGIADVCAVVACGGDEHVIDKFAFRSGGGVTLTPLSHAFQDDVFIRESDSEPLSDHRALAVEFQWSAIVAPTDCGPAGAGVFPDVVGMHAFCAEIEWLADGGVTGGYADGGFHPTSPVTRQSMAAFLYRYSGSPAFTAPTEPTFPDVPPSHPFFLEIEWLVSEAVTGGFADGGYHPGTTVSRQAMASFLHRLAGAPVVPAPGAAGFPDVPPSHPFVNAIGWLEAVGITGGFADGGFHPTSAVSRQAMAAFLQRYDAL